MMNTVQQKVKCQARIVVREPFIDMKQKSMHPVFQNCPYEVSEEEAGKSFGKGVQCYC